MLVSSKALAKFYINDIEFPAPKEWGDLVIEAIFEDDNSQANISQDKFTFVLEAYDYLKNLIESGKIFRMPTFKIVLQNNINTIEFELYIDLTTAEIRRYSYEIVVSVKRTESLNDLSDKIESLSYGFLEFFGYIKQSDYKTIEYVVEEVDDTLKIILLGAMEIQATLLLIDNTEKLAKDLKNSGLFSTTVPLPNIQTTALSIAADLTLSTITFAGSLANFLILGKDLVNAFVHPKREAKTCSLYNLLKGVATHLQLDFKTEFEQKLKQRYYLPSNLEFDEQGLNGLINKVHGPIKGVPNVTDVGYGVTEMFDIAKKIFRGKFAIYQNTLHFAGVDSDYWYSMSNYNLPNIQLANETFNAIDFKANKLIEFATDINELYTLKDFKGTIYENVTEHIGANNKKISALKGLERISIPLTLGSKKTKLTAFQKKLAQLCKVIDKATGIFGGGSTFESQVKSKVGILKVSTNQWNIAKVLEINGSTISDKNTFGAKALFKENYKDVSFVDKTSNAQRKLYNLSNVPMGINDFMKVAKNPYFFQEGKKAKTTYVKWQQASDTCEMSIWINDIYATELYEIEIEPTTITQ